MTAADSAEPDTLFQQEPPVQRRPAAAQDGPAAGDKGFEDLLNSVNSRYSASTRRVAEPSAHMADPLAQEHIVQDTPQPGRVDQDYFPHDSAAPGAGAPLQDAQEAPSFAPVAPPQPGRADHGVVVARAGPVLGLQLSILATPPW